MKRPFAFSDPVRARKLTDAIDLLAPDRPVRIVHVCGTHEATIAEHGLRGLLPRSVEILEGPGCPVCVTPTRDIDAAVKLAERGVTVCTFGDMMRVPGTRRTLEQARAAGGDVRTVLSAANAVEIARARQQQEVVFFAVGFETTVPMTAAIAVDNPPHNFGLLVSHKRIPPAMIALLELPNQKIDAYLAPGHVTTILGTRAYNGLSSSHGIPVVVGGFEPLDVLYALALAVRQIADGAARVENAFPRGADEQGNPAALALLHEVFDVADGHWRGIGTIPESALVLRPRYAHLDARARYEIEGEEGQEEIPGCRCSDVLTAQAVPTDCPLFAKRCTPLTPIGPCMVGAEGACSIWFRYGGRPDLR
ncbi:hydrogenase formation protein HypD [Candidatus Bipolaricaulota bacterium]|nr:hydrogenase formation protein HypD [Candidatus Bipolaricaulota bacterium]